MPLSRYEDNIWDFSPYVLNKNTSNLITYRCKKAKIKIQKPLPAMGFYRLFR
jgi:hypothetical protein